MASSPAIAAIGRCTATSGTPLATPALTAFTVILPALTTTVASSIPPARAHSAPAIAPASTSTSTSPAPTVSTAFSPTLDATLG